MRPIYRMTVTIPSTANEGTAMSRAYRIKVSESLCKIIRAEDCVSTCLEILNVLPQDQMAELLAQELQRRGYKGKSGALTREQNGILISVDPDEGTVTVSVSAQQSIELQGEQTGWAVDDGGKHAKQIRQTLRDNVKDQLEREAGGKQAQLQSKLSDRLEAHLGDLRQELNEVANRVTAEALKRKAAQMGQIKEVTEDPQSGSMTIVLEV
jgi:hypothetical protein